MSNTVVGNMGNPIDAPTSGLVNPYHVDISLATPQEQFATLVAIIEAADQKSPAPYTGTPPGNEWIPEDEYVPAAVLDSNFIPPPDLEPQAETDLIDVISGSPSPEFPHPYWENDDQYHGLGVPPGVPNYGQPIETGHSQITLPNPGAEYGTFAWAGKPVIARVARHENAFPSYNAGQNRGHGVSPEKFTVPYVTRTQQGRDMLLAAIKRRGAHNIVMQDMPAQSYNQQVLQIDQGAMAAMQPEIGAEGVLP